MLRRLYDWIIDHAEQPGAIWTLIAVAFAESSFFPLPPDILLIPMVLAKPRRAFILAGIATVASVAGGFLGYAIGYYLYGSLGQWITSHLTSANSLDSAKAAFVQYGFYAIVLKGMTPIPYKLVTILSGFLRFDLLSFAIASLIARAMRFYLIAGLLYFFGDRVRHFIERRLGLVTLVFLVFLIGAFVAVKFL